MAQPKPVPKVKQRKPLKRSKPMRKRTSRRVKAKTAEDKRYLAWLHRQGCELSFMLAPYKCDGAVQAAHLRNMTGIGRKEPDESCIPLCRKHHEEYDQAKGYFYGQNKPGRKAWHMAINERWRALYASSAKGEP